MSPILLNTDYSTLKDSTSNSTTFHFDLKVSNPDPEIFEKLQPSFAPTAEPI